LGREESMPTVRFFRAFHGLEDRPLTAEEVDQVHQAVIILGDEDRIHEQRPFATSAAGIVNGWRWAAVYRLRAENLPDQADATGAISELALPPGTWVAEGTHFAMLDNAIVPILDNTNGASSATISRYLSAKSALTISLRPLVDPDIIQQLDDLGRVSLVKFEVDDLLDEPAEPEGMGTVINLAHRQHQTAARIEVQLKWEGDSRESAAEGIREWTKRIMNQVERVGRVRKATARGAGAFGERVPTVNLLEGRVAAAVDLDRDDPRRVQRTDAVTAISDAYAQKAIVIKRALSYGDNG
jgi:hypothetical protein